MCGVAGVGRAGYYRDWQGQEPEAEEMEVRARIQQIAMAHRRNYGYRRVCRELKDQGRRVNHKRVARLMAEDNLLAIRRRKYIVTTDSGHDLPVYRNLAARLKLSGINQLWVADITYIRLHRQFLFLAVVLDAYSRRVVGWAVEESLEAFLPMAALRQAIAERQPEAGKAPCKKSTSSAFFPKASRNCWISRLSCSSRVGGSPRCRRNCSRHSYS
jgi:transposase InsO family protein